MRPKVSEENKKKIDMEMSNDTKNGRFKYQEPIDKLLAEGCQLPELFVPNNLQANMSLLSLSCFTEAEKAETFYRNLCKAFKNVQTKKLVEDKQDEKN